jgi:hypothetical protein
MIVMSSGNGRSGKPSGSSPPDEKVAVPSPVSIWISPSSLSIVASPWSLSIETLPSPSLVIVASPSSVWISVMPCSESIETT